MAEPVFDDTSQCLPTTGGWILQLYEEAWRQYVHEDNLVQTRTKLFLIFHGVVLTVMLGMSPFLAKWTTVFFGKKIWIGLILLGLLLYAASRLSRILSDYWRKATKAGMQYVNLRWSTILAIEKMMEKKIDSEVSLAIEEDKWRKASKNAPEKYKNEKHFDAFPTILERNKNNRLFYYNFWGSLSWFREMNFLLSRVWRGLEFIGVVITIATIAWSLLG